MGLKNDKLFKRAAARNLKLIKTKADQKILKNKIINLYKDLA